MVSTRRKTYSPRTAQVVSSPRRARVRPEGMSTPSTSKKESRKSHMEICNDENINGTGKEAGLKPAKVKEVIKMLPAIEAVMEISETEPTDISGNGVKEVEDKENCRQPPPGPGPNLSKQHIKSKSVPIDEKNSSKIIKGANISGRFWKTVKPRPSRIVEVPGLKKSWEKKVKERLDMKRVKELEKQLKAERNQRLEKKRKQVQERRKRKEENIRMAEVVQVIKNTTKLKKMRKKDLVNVQKRDTLHLLQGKS
ncbi:unnamed protein product [Darwinula stevensoni]|uniref:Coiled-coil domain-containing protein 86 n=1 Tax=Darwinula stevensoni TaxID=69355 RepID=A0A7R9A8Q0_9CRUS|nr:unnamed protein product [Darwinula stevensoni]CAG0896600.1 unnamed protein product [Darwinula stevensoni]